MVRAGHRFGLRGDYRLEPGENPDYDNCLTCVNQLMSVSRHMDRDKEMVQRLSAETTQEGMPEGACPRRLNLFLKVSSVRVGSNGSTRRADSDS
jgi:hypothetical protein